MRRINMILNWLILFFYFFGVLKIKRLAFRRKILYLCRLIDNRQQSTVNSQQSTDNSQQITDNRQQSTVNSQQITDNRQQSTDNSRQTINHKL